MKSVEEFPDFPALREVAAALWRRSSISGAAVMVGAGVTRCAELPAPTSQKPPLWGDIAGEMRRRLGGTTTADPLRLAEEFRAALGQSALDALVRDLVQDDQYRPSAPHARLLSLPWADVLTTNWDTLLERTRLPANSRRYALVETPGDIARMHAPRIVKLHGSLPSTTPFIVAEEDYRTYPRRYAPFVNLVQQVLLENELCLLGFSGDDPNFLKWTGWVRDELGDAARPIRLIGALRLSAPRRRYLENLNVTPIDLTPTDAPHDQDALHRSALEMVLDYLHSERPPSPYMWRFANYPRENDKDAPVDLAALAALAETLAKERRSYPGWALPPYIIRQTLRRDLPALLEQVERYATNASDVTHRTLIFECAWRIEKAADACSESLWNRLSEAIASAVGHASGDEVAAGGRVLLRAARERGDEAGFDRAVELVSPLANANADLSCWIAYEKALRARDCVDYPAMLAALESIESKEPDWLLRIGALRCALAQYEIAEQMLDRCRVSLRERRERDPHSPYLFSLESWANWIFRQIRWGRPKPANDVGEPDVDDTMETAGPYDPWREIEFFEAEMRPNERERGPVGIEEVKARFDPGSYTHLRRTKKPTYDHLRRPFDELRRFADIWGVPERFEMFDLLGHRFEAMLEFLALYGLASTFETLRYASRHEAGLLDSRLRRADLAIMAPNEIRDVLAAVRREVDFCWRQWSEYDRLEGVDTIHYVQRARIALEVGSRLAVRLSKDEASGVLRWGFRLAAHPLKHWWVFKPLAHLLRRSLSVFTSTERLEFLTPILKLPLPGESNEETNERDWPELIDLLPDAPLTDRRAESGYATRVYQLIRAVRSDDLRMRSAAIERVSYLQRNGALDNAQIKDFGEGLWSLSDTPFALPRVLDEFAPSLFLSLPAPSEVDVAAAFRKDVVSRRGAGASGKGSLYDLAVACKPRALGGAGFGLAPDEALAIIARRLAPLPTGSTRDWGSERIHRAFDIALADALLPAIEKEQSAREVLRQLIDFAQAADESAKLLRCLPRIANMADGNASACAKVLRGALISRDVGVVLDALDGVIRWASMERVPLPAEVVEDLIRNCVMRHAPALSSTLATAADLLRKGKLQETHMSDLVGCLEMLRIEASYESWHKHFANDGDISLVRRSCVRLATELASSGASAPAISYWLETQESDPLPEVRHATDNAECSLA